MIQKTEKGLQIWKDSLTVTGGSVRPEKCSWILICFRWENGRLVYCKTRDAPASVRIRDDDNVYIPLSRIEPDEGVEGLWV